MRRFTFTNANGVSFVFQGATAPFNLITFEGTGSPDVNNHFKKSPFQDGQTFVGNDLEMRYIDITFSVIANTEKELSEQKKRIAKICNPRLGEGILTYEYEGGINEIPCISEGVKFAYKNVQLEQPAQITFVSPDPYWRDLTVESEPMAAYLGLLEFPLSADTFEIGVQGSKQTFNNVGDVQTPIRVEFAGVATNPRISNLTTGEYLQINQTVLEGETMIIDTSFGNKRKVEIVGIDGSIRNVLNYITLDSTFFQLKAGENEIEYSTQNDEDVSSLIVQWRNRYIGV